MRYVLPIFTVICCSSILGCGGGCLGDCEPYPCCHSDDDCVRLHEDSLNSGYGPARLRCIDQTCRECLTATDCPAGQTCQNTRCEPAVVVPTEVNANIEVLPGVYAFTNAELTAPIDDLHPLSEIVGEARVVALGEAMHTSGGYYQAKARLIRYLVEEEGFRAVAFETTWAAGEVVADYVSTCNGTADDAVREGLFSIWHGAAVRDLVQWLCEFNRSHPDDPVVFFGFDISQPEHDGAAVVEILTTLAPPDGDQWIAGLRQCQSPYQANPTPSITDQDYETCVDAIDATANYLEENETEIIASISAEALEWVRISLIGLRASEDRMYLDRTPQDYPLAWSARDRGMAEVFQRIWLLQAADSRAVIWAHNSHVAHSFQSATVPEMNDLIWGAPNFGSFVREQLGDEYVALALTSYQTIIAPAQSLPTPTDRRHVEVLLHELDEPYLLVDLEFPDNNSPLFNTTEAYRFIGDFVIEMVPREQFRGLVFVDFSPAMNPL